MNTRAIEYIIAVAEEKSQSKAAERLIVSQPALSQQIKKVEEELGEKLFERKDGELVLTDAGKIYVGGARNVLNVYHKTISDIQKIRTRKKKQLTLIYNNTLFPEIEQVLPLFAQLNPDVYVSTIYGNAQIASEYLENGLADIAVMAVLNPNNPTLSYNYLNRYEVQLVLPEDHPLVDDLAQNGINLDKLQNEYFILNIPGSFIRTKTDELFDQKQFIPRTFCEIGDPNAVINMVMNHKGIAFLPENVKKGNNYATISLDPPIYLHTAIATNVNYMPGKAGTDLINLIKENFKH